MFNKTHLDRLGNAGEYEHTTLNGRAKKGKLVVTFWGRRRGKYVRRAGGEQKKAH